VAFRKKHGIPGDAFVVLFLSRIDYKKGLNYLLPALAALKKEFPKVWLVMAGGGQQAFVEGIRAEVAARGMTGWTVFPGFLSGTDKMSAFGAADLFALPSQNENFGIVVVEALQCGLPSLISTGVYIHREIAARDAAVVCEPNEDSCRDGLKKLITDPVLRAQLRERAAAAARELYSPEAANRTLLELYAKVVAKAKSAPVALRETPQPTP
jgi:glycosyltransferase involved in cell wall biosynthesis